MGEEGPIYEGHHPPTTLNAEVKNEQGAVQCSSHKMRRGKYLRNVGSMQLVFTWRVYATQ